MGRQSLLAVICWLAVSQVFGNKKVNSSITRDLKSEESVQQYSSGPLVYASAIPHRSSSFHTPTIISSPKASGSHLVPVREESVILQRSNRFLKDSYGNKFGGLPQSVAYKSMFPQQYVQLQDLPVHLSQPLIAAAPNYHVKQTIPNFFFGSHLKLPPSLQAAAPAPVFKFGGFSRPLVYAQNIKTLAPETSVRVRPHISFTPQQQPTNHKIVYANIGRYGNNYNNEQKFERLKEGTHASKQLSGNNNKNSQIHEIQKSPAKLTTVTTLVDGKPIVVSLETKPPLPLLDLSLLEPLTFANPIVPQVQHFIPKINAETYHALQQPEIEIVSKHQNEYVVQNTKSYDSGLMNEKPKIKDSSKKKTHSHYDNRDSEDTTPEVTHKDSSNGSPEISYEINSPNHKVTYNEQLVSYNKETTDEPLHYSYEKNVQKDPVHYSFQKEVQEKPVHYSVVHTSNEPVQIKEVRYEGKEEEPKTLNYSFNSEDQHTVHDKKVQQTLGNLDGINVHSDYSNGSPHNYFHNKYHDLNENSQKTQDQLEHKERGHNNPHSHQPKLPTKSENSNEYSEESDVVLNHHNHNGPYKESFRDYQHGKLEQKDNEHRYQPTQRENRKYKVPKQISEDIKVPVQNFEPHYQAITPEYEEDIILLSTHKPHVDIRSEQQHNPSSQFKPKENSYSQAYLQNNREQQDHTGSRPSLASFRTHQPVTHLIHSLPPVRNYQPKQHVSQGLTTPATVIHEKSKRIIIQEETPEEMHSHNEKEQLMEEMIRNEENSEEDFEKAYKDAAYGFPSFDKSSEESEKDIYNPESYGTPRYHQTYDIEHAPFEQYQADDDSFPKSARLSYKDSRDRNKDDYYTEYSILKPEVYTDMYKKKEDYYKTYSKQKPERYFVIDDKQKKQNAKYTFTPLYEFKPIAVSEQKPKVYFAQYKAAPFRLEHDHSKSSFLRDDFSRESSVPQSYTAAKTQFVEPQFQYGFEPISIPRLFDSELSAMASNDSPESESPGTRKKVYKENWYIKKTKTSAANPSS